MEEEIETKMVGCINCNHMAEVEVTESPECDNCGTVMNNLCTCAEEENPRGVGSVLKPCDDCSSI